MPLFLKYCKTNIHILGALTGFIQQKQTIKKWKEWPKHLIVLFQEKNFCNYLDLEKRVKNLCGGGVSKLSSSLVIGCLKARMLA